MIATIPTSISAPPPGSPLVELLGIVRRRRSTAGRLDALTRLESERSRLARQSEWSAGRGSTSFPGQHGTPETPF